MSQVTVEQAFELGLEHHQAGRLAEAEGLYRQILAVQPNHAEALHFLGVIACQTGHHDLAVEWIGRAIALNPTNAAAYPNLGVAYRGMGRLDEAIAAFREAIRLQPEFAEAHNNLGNALREQGNLDEAVTRCRRAIQLNADYAEAHHNLGNALKDQGLLDGAIAEFRRSLQIRPDWPAGYEALLLALNYAPGLSKSAVEEERRHWNQRISHPRPRFVPVRTNERNPERRLRIGYVSPDFRDQVVGRNLWPLFKSHDPQKFEILCYSGVVHPDRLTEQFRQSAHEWRSTLGVTDEALAELIRNDQIDILVDLSQHATGNRLGAFGRRPAPVQVSFAGYPESAGLEAIEYRISDRRLEAERADGKWKMENGTHSARSGQADSGQGWEIGWKTEPDLRIGPCPEPAAGISHLPPAERIFLIDSFWCYDPCEAEVAVNELPRKQNGCVTFGSFNSSCKVNDVVLKLWSSVLDRVKGSRLVLLCVAGNRRAQTLEILAHGGIEAERVEFVARCSRQEYLEWHHRVDIALDPFPYGGHTTSLDALWMGVPVVSLAGERAVSRAGLSILSNLGLPELVAFSEEDYVNIAADLAGDLPRLAELRRTLRARMEGSVLMDAARFARNIEGAYRAMWRAWCARQAP